MDVHERFFGALTPEEEHLLILRDFLYDGDWEEVIEDLRSRQEGKPFVIKLNTRIEEDIRRIEKLREYEDHHGINLGHYLIRSGKFPELSSLLASTPTAPKQTSSARVKSARGKK